MKESGGGRLKCAVYESTLSTADAVPLPRWGRQKGGGSAAKKKANPASLRSAAPSKGRGSRGHSLLPMEGERIAHSPYRHFERKREIFFRSRSSRRCEDSGIFVSQPSPRGEGVPKGRIGQKRYEKERGRSSQVRRLRKYPIHRWRGPPSPMGRQRGGGFAAKKKANPASLRSAAPSKGRGSRGHSLLPLEGGAPKGRRLDGDSGIPAPKPSPRGEGGERSEPDRVLAV